MTHARRGALSPRPPAPRLRAVPAGLCFALLLVLVPACGKSTPTAHPGGVVGFDEARARNVNGPIPLATASGACGSATATFATELLDTTPDLAKVGKEWGVVVPQRQMSVAGTVTNFTYSSGDLPFTHPFGKDITWDVRPDRPYAQLAQMHGTVLPRGPLGGLHWELTQGEFPHVDTATYMDGFVPRNGDRVATTGSWIIDCGHSDFHTEIHPAGFVAFGRSQGGSTVVHAFAPPYREAQLYTIDPNLANQVANTARLTDPNTKPFPTALVQVLKQIGHLGPTGFCCLDRIDVHQMLLANRTSPPLPFYVCPPGPGSGATTVAYRFVTRPGVLIHERTTGDGCARFDVELTAAYQPVVPVRKDCVLPWAELTQQAEAATGNPNLDIEKRIEELVPASFRTAVRRDPVVDCYDPLTGPALPAVGSGRGVQISADQSFPFYGWVKVSRSG